MPVRAVVIDLDTVLLRDALGAGYASARADLVDLARDWPDTAVPGGIPRPACLAVLDALADDTRWAAASAAVAAREAAAVRRWHPSQDLAPADPLWGALPLAWVSVLTEAVAREALDRAGLPAAVVVGRQEGQLLSSLEPRVARSSRRLGVPPQRLALISGDAQSRAVAVRLGLGWLLAGLRPGQGWTVLLGLAVAAGKPAWPGLPPGAAAS